MNEVRKKKCDTNQKKKFKIATEMKLAINYYQFITLQLIKATVPAFHLYLQKFHH